MPSWTAPRVVLAMACAFRTARRKAAAVFGYRFSQDWVTMYPLTGRLCAEPWSTSAMAMAPMDSSAAVMNGSGSQAAATWPDWRAAAIFGNGIGTKVTSDGGTP